MIHAFLTLATSLVLFANPALAVKHVPAHATSLVCAKVAGGTKQSKESAPKQKVTRFEKALSDFSDEVVRQFQEFAVQPKDVRDFVESFPTADRIWVKYFLVKLTQWGNLDKLKVVVDRIRLINPKARLVSFETSDFPSVVSYVAKKMNPETTFSLIEPKMANQDDVILVTPEFREYLSQNPTYANFITSHKVKLIALEGFDVGLTFANSATGFEKLRAPVETLLRVRQQVEGEKKHFKSGTESYLWFVGALDWLYETHPDLWNETEVLETAQSPLTPTFSDFESQILSNLNPRVPSRDDIEVRLSYLNSFLSEAPESQFPEIDSHLLMYLKDFMEFAHHRKMQSLLVGMGKKLSRQIDAWKLDESDVRFYIPAAGKSYSVINYMRRELGILPGAKTLTVIPKRASNDRSRRAYVILDDVAGSGASLLSAANFIPKGSYDSIVLAPLFSTPQAQKKLKSRLAAQPTLGVWIQGQAARSGSSSAYLKSQPAPLKAWLNQMKGGSFGNSHLALAFPYMSPDNNVALFGTMFADLLTPPLGMKSTYWSPGAAKTLPATKK